MSTSVVLPYEVAAQHNDPMPDGLELPDQCMFQALALLYARYRLNVIGRDAAVSEKIQLLRKYEAMKLCWEYGKRYPALIKATELANAEYRKNRTIENADKILIAIDGVI